MTKITIKTLDLIEEYLKGEKHLKIACPDLFFSKNFFVCKYSSYSYCSAIGLTPKVIKQKIFELKEESNICINKNINDKNIKSDIEQYFMPLYFSVLVKHAGYYQLLIQNELAALHKCHELYKSGIDVYGAWFDWYGCNKATETMKALGITSSIATDEVLYEN